jgi:hypothetical protein
LVRYTVEVPTESVRAITASPSPRQAASNIWARLSRRARSVPWLTILCNRSRSASSSSTMYRTFMIPPEFPSGTVDHGSAHMSIPGSDTPVFTERQGQYLAFIYAYTKVNRRAPAQADLQRYFDVSPPTVHQMVLTLERNQLIRRVPGQARSLEVLVDPDSLPTLR